MEQQSTRFGDYKGQTSWDESIAGSLLIFSDDPLLPLEYLEATKRKTYYEPEKKLMFALLNDAVYCFQHYFGSRKRSGKKLFSAADQWIFDTEGEGLFTFESVCEHLGIAPGYLRRGLALWKDRKLAEARGEFTATGEVSPRLLAG
jgi:hypothetical protein